MPATVADRLRQEQASLAEELVDRQMAARPDMAARYGASGRERCLEDAHFHLAHLADSMAARSTDLFAEYVVWVSSMLGARGIPAEHLAAHLELTRAVILERLGEEAGLLAGEHLDAALARLPSVPTVFAEEFAPDGPHGELAREFLEAMLAGERHRASQRVSDALAGGVPIREIYLHVVQPVLHEVGRLWQLNRISVAQEHFCTAAAQWVLAQLYHHVFASEKNGGTLVAACVDGNLHEVGLRMVADFFEMAGWRTHYLGASLPPESVRDCVVERGAHVLAISATLTFHLRAMKRLIEVVRAHPSCRDVRILVGGHPFSMVPDLWERMGADGSAPDAQAAIAIAAAWIPDGGRA